MSGDGDAPDRCSPEAAAGVSEPCSGTLRSRAAAWTGADAAGAADAAAAGAVDAKPPSAPELSLPLVPFDDADMRVKDSGSGSHGAGKPPHGEASRPPSPSVIGSAGSSRKL